MASDEFCQWNLFLSSAGGRIFGYQEIDIAEIVHSECLFCGLWGKKANRKRSARQDKRKGR